LKKLIWQFLVIASLLMLLIPDFHPERLYSDGYHEWLDILQHSGYFFAFTLAVLWVFPSFRRFFPFYFLLILLATLLEIAQFWIPKRSFSPMDMCSNVLGISVAYLCWWGVRKITLLRSARNDEDS
jgi:VanZ family protein